MIQYNQTTWLIQVFWPLFAFLVMLTILFQKKQFDILQLFFRFLAAPSIPNLQCYGLMCHFGVLKPFVWLSSQINHFMSKKTKRLLRFAANVKSLFVLHSYPADTSLYNPEMKCVTFLYLDVSIPVWLQHNWKRQLVSSIGVVSFYFPWRIKEIKPLRKMSRSCKIVGK